MIVNSTVPKFEARCPPVSEIFSNKNSGLNDVILNDTSLTIPADPFLYSERYKDFRHYKNLKKKIQKAIKQNNSLSFDTLGLLVKLNPEYFESYEILGDYHQKKSDHKKARIYYKKALKLAIDTCSTIPSIQEKIENLE